MGVETPVNGVSAFIRFDRLDSSVPSQDRQLSQTIAFSVERSTLILTSPRPADRPANSGISPSCKFPA